MAFTIEATNWLPQKFPMTAGYFLHEENTKQYCTNTFSVWFVQRLHLSKLITRKVRFKNSEIPESIKFHISPCIFPVFNNKFAVFDADQHFTRVDEDDLDFHNMSSSFPLSNL